MVLESDGYGGHLAVQPARLVHDLRCQLARRCQHQAAREGGGEGRGGWGWWFVSRHAESQRDGPPLLPDKNVILCSKKIIPSSFQYKMRSIV
jgi:hypothetical protein